MKLTWYGTAAVRMQSGNTAIVFDPFGGIPIGSLAVSDPPIPYMRDFQNISQVFVTHGHFDHIYQIPRIYRDIPVTIHCTDTPADTLIKKGVKPQKIRRIAPQWRGEVGPFSIRTWQGRHCRFDLPLLRKTILTPKFFRHPAHLCRLLKIYASYPENGEILFYEISCEGLRIQLMGSMNLDNRTNYPTGADVLILPLQGRSDQDVYVLRLAERLRPKRILLNHYDNSFPPISGDVDVSGFIKNVQKRYGIPCEPMQKNKVIEISKKEYLQ